MELDELKDCWVQLSERVAQQNKLTAKLIKQMTHQKYQSRINSIAFPEFIGSAICLLAAMTVLLYFNVFDTPLLRVFGGLAVLLLIALPVLSFQSVRGLQHIDMSLSTYAQTLTIFLERKIRFQRLRKVSVWLNIIFMLVSLPVAARLIAGKDITHDAKYLWMVLPLGIFLAWFSRWTLRHYDNVLKRTEALLRDVEG